jgi:tetratricopeptide (TPR) repeat protein
MSEEIPTSPRIENLRERLAADPNSRLFLQLAEEYRRSGALELAAKVCRDGLEKHPNYHAARVALARACVQMGRAPEAVSELKKVLKAAPDNILAGKLLGQIYESVGRPESALATYRRLLPYDPDDAELLERIQSLGQSVETAAPPAPPPEQKAPMQEPAEEAPPPPEEEPAPAAPAEDEGTAIMDEPPELEGSSYGRFLSPIEAADALPPEMQGEVNEMSHELDQELDQTPAADALPDALNLTPSPDLLPQEIQAEGSAPAVASQPGTQDATQAEESRQPPTPDSVPAEEGRVPEQTEETPEEEGVTSRTMAELLHKQGHLDQAIETMERLVLADQAGKEDEAWLAGLLAERGDRLGRRFEAAAGAEADRARLETYRRWLQAIDA